jgi:hypothetical protein
VRRLWVTILFIVKNKEYSMGNEFVVVVQVELQFCFMLYVLTPTTQIVSPIRMSRTFFKKNVSQPINLNIEHVFSTKELNL